MAKGFSPTALKAHMAKCDNVIYKELDDQARQDRGKAVTQSIRTFVSDRPTSATLQQNQVDAMVLWVVQNNLPYGTVECKFFREMIRSTSEAGLKSLGNVSRQRVKDGIKNLELNLRKKIREKIGVNPVSATLDHWTSRAKDNYLAFTVHWISDFTLLSAVMDVKVGSDSGIGSGKAEVLVKQLESDMKLWHLPASQIPFVVTDTEATMNSLGRKMRRAKGMEFIYCIDHLLQTVSTIIYKEEFLGEHSGDDNTTILRKARSLATFFNSSTQALFELKDIQRKSDAYTKEPLGVVQDVTTRWWSTYSMIERLLYLRPALDDMVVADGLELAMAIHDDEWEVLEILTLLLRPFRSAQLMLEGQKYVTISFVIPIVKEVFEEVQRLTENQDLPTMVQACGHAMLDKMEEIFGDTHAPFNAEVQYGQRLRQLGIHPACIKAHLLDPRFKHLQYIESETNKELLQTELVKEMIAAAAAESRASGERNPKRARLRNLESDSDSDNEDDDNDDNEEEEEGNIDPLLLSFITKDRQAAKSARLSPAADALDVEVSCKAELELYLKCEGQQLCTRNKSEVIYSDPLIWWKAHHATFPRLWYLARKYLCITATSAPSERAFSVAGNILTNKRCTIGTTMFSENVFVKENMNHL